MELNPNYKESVVGVIPKDWGAKRFGEVLRRLNAKDHQIQTADYQATGAFPVVDQGKAPIVGYSDREDKLFRCGNEGVIVFGDHTCIVKYVDFDFVVGADGTQILAAQPDQSARFYAYQLEQSGIPTTGYNRHFKFLKERFFAAPSVHEQVAIVAALSDVDALLKKLDQLIAKKRDLKQGAMQDLLTGQVRLPGFRGDWATVSAGDIGRFRGGAGFPTRFQGVQTGDYPFYKVSDMNNAGNETFMGAANNYISEPLRKQLCATAFPAESIVFAKVGAAVFLERKKILTKPSCLDNNMAAFVVDASLAHYRFIHYVLLNTNLGDLVSATALPSLNGSVLSAIELRIPPLAEQSAIAAFLSDMDAEIAALETRREKTRAIKQGVMQELLTGRIRLI